MCFDKGEWLRPASYRKHLPRPSDTRAEVVAKSKRRSLYYPGVDVSSLEEAAAKRGRYLDSTGGPTIHKVQEMERDIGASEGEPSRWLLVESTSGTYHGYPITEARYRKWLQKTRECCNENETG